MSEFFFAADKPIGQFDVPDFEDARADFAPYYAIERGITDIQYEVMAELAKLGATGFLQAGHFLVNGRKRYGYRLVFNYGGAQGLIRIAGLPVRSETPRRVEQVRKQALANLRDWLKTTITSQIFSPGANALIPFLLVDNERTVADVMIETGHLPMLNPPPDERDVLEAEIVE